MKTGPDDYEGYLTAEKEYLENLKTEPEEVLRTVRYMESLSKLQEAEYVFCLSLLYLSINRSTRMESEEAKKEYNRLDYGIINLGWKAKEITRVKTRYRTTHSRWMAANEDTLRLEEELGIEVRWTTNSQPYKDAMALMTERRYRRALDNLELLAVQRLFELTKLGMSGVGESFCYWFMIYTHRTSPIGYKLREKIGRALKARSKAIKNALDEYNSCAAKLNPPRPGLTWSKVVDAVYIAELDMLRDARQDIRTLKWAQPAQREAMNLYFGLKRAREELKRLNVEIRRLLTFIRDDYLDYWYAISSHIVNDPDLAHELSCQWQYRDSVHEGIFRRLQQTANLRNFSGVLMPGRCIEREHNNYAGVPIYSQWLKEMMATNGDEDSEAEEDDKGSDGSEQQDDNDGDTEDGEVETNVDGMIEFMETLEEDNV